MAAINGSLILLHIEDPAIPGSFVAATCQLDAGIDESVAEIVTSCKDSRAKTIIGGEYSWSGSLELLYHPGDALQDELTRRFRAGELFEVHIFEDGVDKETGLCLITGYKLAAPREDAAKRSISVAGSGFLVAS